MKYTVNVDDNFHYMDEDERYTQGVYNTAEEALGVARKIVDDFLSSNYKAGMTAKELFDYYKSFGEDPFIVSEDKTCQFSAWTHARERCNEICGPSAQGLSQDNELLSDSETASIERTMFQGEKQ